MSRAVLIARIAAVLMILGMILLLMNLHAKLSRMSPREKPAATTKP